MDHAGFLEYWRTTPMLDLILMLWILMGLIDGPDPVGVQKNINTDPTVNEDPTDPPRIRALPLPGDMWYRRSMSGIRWHESARQQSADRYVPNEFSIPDINPNRIIVDDDCPI